MPVFAQEIMWQPYYLIILLFKTNECPQNAPNYNFLRGDWLCTNTRKNPAVPVTPAEIVKSAIEAVKAGASVVHCHVRDPETTQPSMSWHFIGKLQRAFERVELM